MKTYLHLWLLWLLVLQYVPSKNTKYLVCNLHTFMTILAAYVNQIPAVVIENNWYWSIVVSINLPWLFLQCARCIIKESENVLAVHNIYWWCLGILNLVCWLIMTIPTNCVWNIGFKWAITKYFRGMHMEVLCGKFSTINADIWGAWGSVVVKALRY